MQRTEVEATLERHFLVRPSRLLLPAFSSAVLVSLASGVAALGTTFAGCSSSVGASSDAGDDHATILTGFDAPAPIESGTDATPLHTSLRIALLSPLGFGVDVCVGPTSGPYVGPLLYEQLPSDPDGGDGGERKDSRPAHETGPLPEAGQDSASDSAAEAEAGRLFDGSLEGGHDAPFDARADSSDASLADALRESGHGSLDAAIDAGADAPLSLDGGQRVGGVLYLEVSHYLRVANAGTVNVAIVRGGSATCNSPLVVQRVTLNAGEFSTIVLESPLALAEADAGASVDADRADAAGARDATSGTDAHVADVHADGPRPRDGAGDVVFSPDASIPLSLVVLTDEPVVSTTLARARFFNGSTALGPVSVAALEQGTTIPLAATVPVDHQSVQNPASPAVDSLGYWQGAPLVSTSPISLLVTSKGVVVDAGDDASAPATWGFGSTTSFDLTQGQSNHSGFLVGTGTADIQLVWCDDTSAANQTLTSCTTVSAN